MLRAVGRSCPTGKEAARDHAPFDKIGAIPRILPAGGLTLVGSAFIGGALPRRAIQGLLLLFVLETGLAGCRSGGGGAVKPELRDLETAPWGDPTRVVAEVNGKPITRGDFYAR